MSKTQEKAELQKAVVPKGNKNMKLSVYPKSTKNTKPNTFLYEMHTQWLRSREEQCLTGFRFLKTHSTLILWLWSLPQYFCNMGVYKVEYIYCDMQQTLYIFLFIFMSTYFTFFVALLGCCLKGISEFQHFTLSSSCKCFNSKNNKTSFPPCVSQLLFMEFGGNSVSVLHTQYNPLVCFIA